MSVDRQSPAPRTTRFNEESPMMFLYDPGREVPGVPRDAIGFQCPRGTPPDDDERVARVAALATLAVEVLDRDGVEALGAQLLLLARTDGGGS